ncbi:C40 family peptidase [Dinoroseobacter sp. S375]|uniref:C40 family peptidase n=1 Tax=Dinoroseobacter sp. S375 TaxID=3415136 RepID=UPI003C7E58F7
MTVAEAPDTLDRRRTGFDGETALETLRGQVDAARFVPGRPARVTVPETPLTRRPTGGADKALLFGEPVTVISESAEHAFVQSGWDGYVGYVTPDALGGAAETTHHLVARASHLYSEPHFKSRPLQTLSLGSALAGARICDGFLETPDGFVPVQHVAERDIPKPILETALSLVDTPYLWAGNSAAGTDCSGLVQLAFRLAGHACPRDSDQQAAEIGVGLPEGAALQAEDVICWHGHVGLMLDADRLLHANIHHMAVAVEPLAAALKRISAYEYGEVTTIRRLA